MDGPVQDDVMNQLKRHLASAEQIDVSRYQFVNIERVREAAGDLWPGLRERVFVATRSIIERKVAEDDLIIQCATGYLVIFKALSGAGAQKLTDKIAAELEAFFLGQSEINQLSVDAKSEQLSLEEFTATLAAVEIEEERPRRAASSANGSHPASPFDQLVYQPVWDTTREAVASYFVSPRQRCPDTGRWRTPTALSAGAELKPDARLDIDQAVLDGAADALEALMKQGTRCALIIPAGFTALSNPRTRSQYVTALAALPRALRPLIWIRLEDADADAPASIVAETARILLSQTAKLFVHARTDWLHLSRFEQIGVSAIGATFPDPFNNTDRQDVDRMLAGASRARSLVYFDGVHTWEAARAALRTGARMIAGRAVGEQLAPSAPFRLSRAKLLSGAA